MQKAYTKINWKNSPNTSTPLGESTLVPMDASIDEIDDRVVTFDTTKANQSDLLTCLSGVTYDSSSGVFVFTFKNGNTVTADLNIEKIPVSFSMDAYGVITMTTTDGTQYTADVGALIKTYTFSDSSEIDFTETVDGSGNKTVTASIVAGSIDGTKLTPNYLADAQAARTGAQTAATLAESWAEGGTGTRAGEDTNNSKYWAQQAQFHSSKHTIEKADGTDMTNRQNLQFIGATITDDSANDRTVVTIQGGGHTIENASGTAMTQRDNLQFDGDVTVTDDSANNRTKVTVSGGGHTIWNRIKTALTQRSKLWFKDATVSDVSADGASAVEVLTSISESDFDNLATDGTVDGIYEINSSNVTPLMADNIGFDPTGTDLSATDTDGAIKEIAEGFTYFNTAVAGTWIALPSVYKELYLVVGRSSNQYQDMGTIQIPKCAINLTGTTSLYVLFGMGVDTGYSYVFQGYVEITNGTSIKLTRMSLIKSNGNWSDASNTSNIWIYSR